MIEHITEDGLLVVKRSRSGYKTFKSKILMQFLKQCNDFKIETKDVCFNSPKLSVGISIVF